MGILYSVYPLDPELRTALPGMGVPTVPAADGRNPTAAELRSVMTSLAGYKATFKDPIEGAPWQVMVEDPHDPERGGWTLLNVSQFPGEGRPCEFWFEKGWPTLVVEIVSRVADQTGTLVLFADCGGAPLVVEAGADPVALYDGWQSSPDGG